MSEPLTSVSTFRRSAGDKGDNVVMEGVRETNSGINLWETCQALECNTGQGYRDAHPNLTRSIVVAFSCPDLVRHIMEDTRTARPNLV